jgi:hypothetical protein
VVQNCDLVVSYDGNHGSRVLATVSFYYLSYTKRQIKFSWTSKCAYMDKSSKCSYMRHFFESKPS